MRPAKIDIANAERIVLCWNSHDALCEALEGVLGQLEIAICSAGFEAVESYVENAKGVLASARGETPKESVSEIHQRAHNAVFGRGEEVKA